MRSRKSLYHRNALLFFLFFKNSNRIVSVAFTAESLHLAPLQVVTFNAERSISHIILLSSALEMLEIERHFRLFFFRKFYFRTRNLTARKNKVQQTHTIACDMWTYKKFLTMNVGKKREKNALNLLCGNDRMLSEQLVGMSLFNVCSTDRGKCRSCVDWTIVWQYALTKLLAKRFARKKEVKESRK